MDASLAPAPIKDLLTQAEAEARAARVSGVSYALDIRLTKGASTYRGEALIRFDLKGAGDLFLDFRGKKIETLEVNGKTVPPRWTGYRLTLPGASLAAKNTIRIAYENEYDHTGDGLHQFKDPEDGEEYLYTNFEPYEAHRLFPCFDQPDVKATYALTVTAPSAWEVVAGSPEASREPAGEGLTRRRFAETKPFSTYLFSLMAGPYQAFREDHKGIPLGVFCRKSMARHLDTPEVFTLTRQGLDFFQDFFACPYPFGKYDQVFVPEFNAGAMENVAAVTHSESMVFRDPPTGNQRRRRAEVILHEMAHMWFGNLVTMRWWNDLWLNESFATYMAYLAMTEATRFTRAWQNFNAMKNWAYRQDQLVTTHPVACQVADTEQTLLNFDGITYAKGASSIKQLVAVIGMERFRDGMRQYFKRHAYGNATLSQFLEALESGSGKDLHAWARLWLETPSLNTVAAAWTARDGKLESLTLVQTAPAEHPTLRPHRMDIALVREEGKTLAVDALPAEIHQAETAVPGAAGRPAPCLLVPNHNDHAYLKVLLDPVSLDFAKGSLERIEDPLLRQIVWQSLWQMLRDQKLPSLAFLDLVAAKLPGEKDQELVADILDKCAAAMDRFVPEESLPAASRRFFSQAWKVLEGSLSGDLRIIWARALIGEALTPEDTRRLADLLDGKASLPGLALDQDMRWGVVTRCAAQGFPDAADRIAAERRRDPSDRGQRAALRAEASFPAPEAKAAAWARFHDGKGYGSLHLTSAAMSGFNWSFQKTLLSPYVDEFFSRVPGIFDKEKSEFSRAYFSALFPGYRVEAEILDRSKRLLATLPKEQPLLSRMLKEAMDDLERAIACRRLAGAGRAG